MREIKCRGKRTDNGEWVYGNLVYMQGLGAFWTTGIQMHSGDGFRSWVTVAVNPETVGQYTGLKDKSGVEVYEGDVCNHYGRFGLEKGVIKFLRYGFHVVLDGGYAFKIDEFHLEVIGNIYEHSHLLEVAK